MVFRVLSFLILLILTMIPWVLLHTQPDPDIDGALVESEALAALTEERDALAEKVVTLENQMDAADRDLIQISNQHTEQSREIERLERELATSRTTFETTSDLLKEQITRLREELATTRARSDKAEAENLDLLRQLARLEASGVVPQTAPAAPASTAPVAPTATAPENGFAPPSPPSAMPMTQPSTDFPVALPEGFQEPQPQPERDRSSGWLFAE